MRFLKKNITQNKKWLHYPSTWKDGMRKLLETEFKVSLDNTARPPQKMQITKKKEEKKINI